MFLSSAMKINPKHWKPTCNRFVAFLDILGFKDRVFREKHQDVLNNLLDFRKTLQEIDNTSKGDIPATIKSFTVKPAMFSDSIILFSSDSSLMSARILIVQTQSLIEKAISIGIPIKGAIAFG